jgi:hypothetical protein
MRFLLPLSLALFSAATAAHTNPPENFKCETRLCDTKYELKEAEFNALVRAEDENKEIIKNIGNEISNSALPQTEKSELLDELQKFSETSNERIAGILTHQPTTENGIYNELKTVNESLQTDYADFRARIRNRNEKNEKSVAEQQRLEKMNNMRSLQNLDGDPTLLQPNRSYIVSDASSAQLKSVQFNSEVVEYLRQDPKGPSFLKAIQKGFVGNRGESGVKRLAGSNIVEVKVAGPRQNDRLIGCYENGVLRLLRSVSKRGNKLGTEKYTFLCKK